MSLPIGSILRNIQLINFRIFFLMFSSDAYLSSSAYLGDIYSEFKPYENETQQSSSTAETIIQPPNSIELVYFNLPQPSSQSFEQHESRLITTTLSHCNLAWMQKLLVEVTEKGAQVFHQNQSPNMSKKQSLGDSQSGAINNVRSQIDELSKMVDQSLAKIAQTRELLIRKLPEQLLKTSASFAIKHAHKANLLKYRELLVSVQSLTKIVASQVESEEEIEEFREKFKASGIVLTTQLLQNTLMKAAHNFISSQVKYRVKKERNLQQIIDNELNECIKASDQPQLFYRLFQKYINLKKYLIYEQDQGKQIGRVDEICQQKLVWQMKNYCYDITRVEFEKTEGLAQCFTNTRQFIKKLASEMKDEVREFAHKKIADMKKSESPLLSSTLEEDMAESLRFIESRSFLFHTTAAKQLKVSLLLSYLHYFFIPLFEYSMWRNNFKDGKDKSKPERRYGKIRIIQLYYKNYQDTVDKILAALRVKNTQVAANWKVELPAPSVIMNSSKKNKFDTKQIKNSLGEEAAREKGHWCMGKVFNEACGRSVFYIVSKIQLLLCQQKDGLTVNHLSTCSKELQKLWIKLVAQELSEKILEESRENILAKIKFMGCQILEEVELMVKLNSQDIQRLMKESSQIQSKKSQRQTHKQQEEVNKKGTKWSFFKKKTPAATKSVESLEPIECAEQLHATLMQVNLKTIRYEELICIASRLGIQRELESMHEKLYNFYTKSQ